MAAKKTYTIGLSKIEVGAIAEDGGMGETLDGVIPTKTPAR